MRNLLVFGLLSILIVPDLMSSIPGKAPDVWNVPSDKENYWDRKAQNEKLRAYLTSNKTGQIAITGISGAGKSEFCKHYLGAAYKDYDIVWWIDAKRDVGSQFQQLALDWNLAFTDPKDQIPLDKLSDAGVVRYVKEKLRKTNKRWVIIFDGAVSMESVNSFIPTVHDDQNQRKHVIITSQSQHGWKEQIQLSEFSTEEATLYAQAMLSDESPEDIKRLLNISSRIPFHLASNIKAIHESHMKIHEFVVKGENSMRNAKMGQSSVLPAFESYKNDLRDIQASNPAAYGVLVLLSVKQGTALPKPIVETFISQQYPTANFVEAINALRGKSFLNEVQVANDSVESFFIHDIVQKAVSEEISDEMLLDFTNKLAAILVSQLDIPWDEMVTYTSRNPQIVALAHQIWEFGKERKLATIEYFRLGMALMEYHMFKTREHVLYEDIFKHLRFLQEKLGSKHIPQEVLHKFYIDIVYIRGIYGDSSLVSEVGQNLLSAVMALKDSDNKDLYLRSLTNTAQFFLFQGDLDKAWECLSIGESIQAEVKRISNRNLYWYIRSWAYFAAGDFGECDRCLDLIFASFDKESNRAMKMYAMNMRANTYLATGRVDESIAWCRKSLEEASDYFQNESSELTAEALMILGRGQIRLKNYKEAKESLSKSLAIYEVYFRPDNHPDQAVVLRSLGEIYLAEDNFDKALAFLTRAMNVYTKEYGEEFKSMNEVGDCLVALSILGVRTGQEELAQKYLRLHIKNFGADHQGTKAIFKAFDEKKGLI